MMDVVLATNNRGKILEFEALLSDMAFTFIPQATFAISDADETGTTFIENAIIKARHASKLSGLPALADDSGLVVKALNGAPGIYSARYAGHKVESDQHIQKLLHEMKNVPASNRQAYFYCVLVWMNHELDPTPLIATGIWHGTILLEKSGTKGFGYDPILYLPELGKTAAELDSETKNKLSHRAQALKQMKLLLSQRL